MEEFLFFIWNFNMTLAASGPLETDAKVLYLHKLVCGEALCQFDLLSSDMKSKNPSTVKAIILRLGAYFLVLNLYQRKSTQCAA